jgi:hypothetical protein
MLVSRRPIDGRQSRSSSTALLPSAVRGSACSCAAGMAGGVCLLYNNRLSATGDVLLQQLLIACQHVGALLGCRWHPHKLKRVPSQRGTLSSRPGGSRGPRCCSTEAPFTWNCPATWAPFHSAPGQHAPRRLRSRCARAVSLRQGKSLRHVTPYQPAHAIGCHNNSRRGTPFARLSQPQRHGSSVGRSVTVQTHGVCDQSRDTLTSPGRQSQHHGCMHCGLLLPPYTVQPAGNIPTYQQAPHHPPDAASKPPADPISLPHGGASRRS